MRTKKTETREARQQPRGQPRRRPVGALEAPGMHLGEAIDDVGGIPEPR
jgi:hypothetical protein